MGKGSETMSAVPEATVAEAWRQVGASFEYFRLTAGVSALSRIVPRSGFETPGCAYSGGQG